MRKITLKFAAAIFTFIIGISSVGLWIIYPFSLNQALNGMPINAVVTEDADEYAVYSTVISELFVKDKENVKRILVSNQTSAHTDAGIGWTVERLKKTFPLVREEALVDYDVKLTQQRNLSPSLSLPVKYFLIDEKAYKIEAGDMVELSCVGFDKERNQAFVKVNFFCAGLCGRGDYVLLEKVDDVWTIKEVFNAWVS